MAEKKTLANVVDLVPLSNLLVPEHRIPISVILRLRFSVENMVEDMEIVNMSLTYTCP